MGLAAWFLDHDAKSYELIARIFEGRSEGLTRDDVLDNITIAWLTNTAISGAHLYWENKLPFFAPMGVKVPIAVSAFPDELYQVPRTWAERAYLKLIHYNRLEKGRPLRSLGAAKAPFGRTSHGTETAPPIGLRLDAYTCRRPALPHPVSKAAIVAMAEFASLTSSSARNSNTARSREIEHRV
jgi:hypothetical protein